MKKGLLLLNLGTPSAPDVPSVRRYLREFLSDPRVIDLPAPLRYLLLYGFILPFRSKHTAKAYQKIWGSTGSPLRTLSLELLKAVQIRLGNDTRVAFGMRYGEPSLEKAIEALSTVDELTILPLYPQYSSAATGSSISAALKQLAHLSTIPSVRVIRDFYQHPAFIHAEASLIKPFVAAHDYILFSYHGLPEKHLMKSGCNTVCVGQCPTTDTLVHVCYRAQCFQTTRCIAEALQLNETQYSTSFQSRLGKTPWIKPYTDHTLETLAQRGVKRLALVCPSFVTDCLETLEEIGVQARAEWLAKGGEHFTLIPCLNTTDTWINAIASIVNE